MRLATQCGARQSIYQQADGDLAQLQAGNRRLVRQRNKAGEAAHEKRNKDTADNFVTW
jgi:hypothetical protein